MLRLDLPADPFWIDCPFGVRLLVRPLTTALNHVAITRAARRLREMRDAAPDDPLLADPDFADGMLRQEIAVAMGEACIMEWHGVGNADGTEAAAITPASIRVLLTVPEVARAFDIGLAAPLARMTAEGNA
jgi:hypothetical protein